MDRISYPHRELAHEVEIWHNSGTYLVILCQSYYNILIPLYPFVSENVIPGTYGRVLNDKYLCLDQSKEAFSEEFVPGNFLYVPSHVSKLLFFMKIILKLGYVSEPRGKLIKKHRSPGLLN